MRFSWACVSALIAAVFLVPSPVQAQKVERSSLVGWWGYDKKCPASDDGFSLKTDGRASDGRGTYDGRWSLREGQVIIIWNATESERRHIKRSEWRIVENFSLTLKPQQRAMLVNTKNQARAWLCRIY